MLQLMLDEGDVIEGRAWERTHNLDASSRSHQGKRQKASTPYVVFLRYFGNPFYNWQYVVLNENGISFTIMEFIVCLLFKLKRVDN